jgi:hypothetical protein
MAAGGSCERKLALQRGLQGSDPSSARFEGTHSEIKPGQNFRNLTYEQLKRAGAGTIRVNADGSLTMTSDPLG